MKGQISFAEFVVSFAVFSIFISYMFFRLIAYMPAYLDELRKEKIRSQAYQLSEFLINDPGSPIDWQLLSTPDSVSRIGLSSTENKTNYLSVEKVSKLESYCSDYDLVKRKLGVDYQFSISISDEGGAVPPGSVFAICSPKTFITRSINATVNRLVSFDNGNFGELIVNVW